MLSGLKIDGVLMSLSLIDELKAQLEYDAYTIAY